MADLEEHTPKGSAFAARAAIISVVVLTAIAIALIGWRWYHVRFPNSALFVRGTEAVAGAEQGMYNIAVRREGATLVNDRMYVPNGSGVLVQVVRDEATTQPTTAPSRFSGNRPQLGPTTSRLELPN